VSADPVPLSATLIGEVAVEFAIATFAERAPAAAGVKSTVSTQLAEAARLDGHVFPAMAKSPAFVPVTVMLLRLTAPVPVFAMETVCDADVIPTVVAANVSDAGETVSEELPPSGAGFTAQPQSSIPASRASCGTILRRNMVCTGQTSCTLLHYVLNPQERTVNSTGSCAKIPLNFNGSARSARWDCYP